MDPKLEICAAKLAVILHKPILLLFTEEHESEDEEDRDDGFEINCNVYKRFRRDAGDVTKPKTDLGKQT